MNKTEASYVNTLLRYVLLDARDENNPGPETARWAAAQLADRAHAQLVAGISRARCEQLWDAEPPTPRGFRPDPWAETAEGLAAADADPAAVAAETVAPRVVPIEQRGLIAGTARTIARQRRDGGRA